MARLLEYFRLLSNEFVQWRLVAYDPPTRSRWQVDRLLFALFNAFSAEELICRLRSLDEKLGLGSEITRNTLSLYRKCLLLIFASIAILLTIELIAIRAVLNTTP